MGAGIGLFVVRAEEVVDKAVEIGKLSSRLMYPKCRTLSRSLIGFEGWSPLLAIHLTQEFDVPIKIAEGLVRRYGGRAVDVLAIGKGDCGRALTYL